MLYLLDTNVLSELRKGPRCNSSVNAWAQVELAPNGGAVSVIALGEIRKGIELLSRRDAKSATRLELWLEGLYHLFSDHILPVTSEIAEEWGRLNAQRPLPATDSLLGATANIHRLVFATRNVRDLRDVGVRVSNPFEFSSL